MKRRWVQHCPDCIDRGWYGDYAQNQDLKHLCCCWWPHCGDYPALAEGHHPNEPSRPSQEEAEYYEQHGEFPSDKRARLEDMVESEASKSGDFCAICHAPTEPTGEFTVCHDPQYQENVWGGDSHDIVAYICSDCGRKLK